MNLFAEIVADGGQDAAFLQRCPGLTLLVTIGNGPIRGMWQMGNYGYVVSGDKFFRVDSAWTATEIGTDALSGTGSGPVSMADNGTQIFVACDPRGFIYNRVSNTITEILDPDFPGAVTVGYLDGYFVFNEPDSQRLWITSLLDGTMVDALDFASAEGSPDGLVALIVDHREVWLFGTQSTEVWYNAATPDFPLQRIQGAYNEVGLIAPYSVAKLDNTIFWLGADARGRGIVYRAEGYAARRISTHAIEWQIQQYENLEETVAYTYQQDGHSFYVLAFPNQNTTWVYDASTESWHERAEFMDGMLTRHRGNCQMSYANQIAIGDFENGNVYAFDLTNYSDNGAIQKWVRSWRALPTGQNDLKRTAQHNLQLNCQMGVGLVTGQGSSPRVMLRWSDDGGHTWSNEHWTSMGAIGQYGLRAMWRRLGMTQKLRDRVYEVSATDPVKIAIMGAEIIASGTAS